MRYRSNMLIGRFDSARLPVPGGVLDVAFIGDPPTDRTRFDRWLVQSAADVATVYGLFPVPSAQIIVIFERDDDVGFGATARGGGPGVILHVGREASSQTLAEDWTATHELFHLGMPLIERNDAWLSEGVTTVYTYLAMARSGRITPAEAFAEIAAGFARGEAYGTGRPLAQESAAMHQTRAYWRVYWGGGAWTLDRMAALATAGHDFDEVLLQWSTLNRDPGPARSAAELLRWADRVQPGLGLSTSADAVLRSSDFPPWQATFASLGLTPRGQAAADDQPANGGQQEPAADGMRASLLAPTPPARFEAWHGASRPRAVDGSRSERGAADDAADAGEEGGAGEDPADAGEERGVGGDPAGSEEARGTGDGSAGSEEARGTGEDPAGADEGDGAGDDPASAGEQRGTGEERGTGSGPIGAGGGEHRQ